MFTGIVEQLGRLRARSVRHDGAVVEVACTLASLTLGESVAVDGVCLTVTRVLPGGFAADASQETLRRTTLGERAVGDRVNLERALRLGDRLGGHLVAGHVDGVGEVRAREPVGDAERVTVDAPPELLRFLAAKGSVTMDGVSLTVNALTPTGFEVMLVPFTRGATALGERRRVNLEVDLLARYVARALEARDPGDRPPGVSLALLAAAGYLDQGRGP
jgi:riboflavin synthase